MAAIATAVRRTVNLLKFMSPSRTLKALSSYRNAPQKRFFTALILHVTTLREECNRHDDLWQI
jgi:hypothetical protein